MAVKVGVLALQGDVSEHIAAFQQALRSAGEADTGVVQVRKAEEIPLLDALAIPGGESTTISRLIDKNAMRSPIERFEGGIFATCAGMVLLAGTVDDPRVSPLALMDMSVARNAFGRQRESFEASVRIRGLAEPFHAVFIRAPVVTATGPRAEP
ncbi:MAG: pyridoxal 5'-phosphate synthase glutaminase subunit PdxT, partial [Methanomicrobiales archaeon]|nr:pyridoxal 5'-phosphate synthase glutaminase subunit PdxT [Methanomicrobiales archaeon]